MRVLSVLSLLAVVVQSATIWDALRASKQFTQIVDIVNKVPELKQILADPGAQVTFFAPSNNALKNIPFSKPFRYLFDKTVDVSSMKPGTHTNYRGETIAFDMDYSFANLRTEFVFLPGTDEKVQARILRAPLRKEGGLLENGNLYYINRLVYQCGEITYQQCLTVQRCKGQCTERFVPVAGTNVIGNYPALDGDFKPDVVAPTPVPLPSTNSGAAPASAPAPVQAPGEVVLTTRSPTVAAPTAPGPPAPAVPIVEEDVLDDQKVYSSYSATHDDNGGYYYGSHFNTGNSLQGR